MNRIDIKLRQLARSSYWQNLYRASKECSNIQLFENVSNFSRLQIRFFYWLTVYNMLYEELMTLQDNLLTNAVINDDIRTDAYLHYRNKKHEGLWKKHRREEQLAEIKTRHPQRHKDGTSQLIDVDLRSE